MTWCRRSRRSITALPEWAAGKVLMHVALVVSHSLMLPSFPADAYTPPSLRYRTLQKMVQVAELMARHNKVKSLGEVSGTMFTADE